MNRFSKFCNDTLVNYYKKRMEDYRKEYVAFDRAGDHAQATILYRRYLKYKDRLEKLQAK